LLPDISHFQQAVVVACFLASIIFLILLLIACNHFVSCLFDIFYHLDHYLQGISDDETGDSEGDEDADTGKADYAGWDKAYIRQCKSKTGKLLSS
jgi:hypothetical protein